MKGKKKFENKFREEASLPEGFSWDEMSEGIFDKLSDLKPEEVKKSDHKYKYILLLLLLLVGIGGCFIFITDDEDAQYDSSLPVADRVEIQNNNQDFYSNEEGENGSDEIRKDNLSLLPPDRKVIAKDKLVQQSAADASNESRKEADYLKSYSFEKSSTATLKKKIVNGITIEDTLLKDSDVDNNDVSNKINNNVSNEFSESDKLNEPLFSGGEQSLSDKEKGSVVNLLRHEDDLGMAISVMEVPKLAIRFLTHSFHTNFNLPLMADIESNQNMDAFSSKQVVTIGSGSNFMLSRYNNTPVGIERNENDISINGLSFMAAYEFQITNSLALSSGVHWNRYFSEFNFTKVTNSLGMLSDQLVEIRTSILTGELSYVRASVQPEVKTTRTVRHFNRIDQLGIPVSLRWVRGNQKLEYYLGAGVLCSLQFEGAGKTVSESSIIEYGPENKILSKTMTFGLIGEAGMRYYLKDDFFIGSNLFIGKSISNWSSEQNEELKPLGINGMLTFGRRF